MESKLSDFIKKICVLKMNESITGLEQYEVELLTEFIFWGEISL